MPPASTMSSTGPPVGDGGWPAWLLRGPVRGHAGPAAVALAGGAVAGALPLRALVGGAAGGASLGPIGRNLPVLRRGRLAQLSVEVGQRGGHSVEQVGDVADEVCLRGMTGTAPVGLGGLE